MPSSRVSRRRSQTPSASGDNAPPGPSHLFRLDLREASTVGLDAERKALVIEVWTPEQGVRTMKRS